MRIAWPTLSTRMSKTDTAAATTTTKQKPSDDNSNWKEKVANEQQQQRQQQTETKTTTIKLLVKTFSIKKLKSRKPLKQSDPQAWSEFESESSRVRVCLRSHVRMGQVVRLSGRLPQLLISRRRRSSSSNGWWVGVAVVTVVVCLTVVVGLGWDVREGGVL